MDELLELFKGQLSFEHFDKLTYRELDLLKNARVSRLERERKKDEERRKEANRIIR